MSLTRLIPVLIVAAVAVYFLISNYYASLPEIPQTRYLTAGIENATFELEIADTEGKRMAGLSGRPALEENKGMIFFFDRADRHGIWMKGMKFPIDIVWLMNKKVVHIVENAQPSFDSNPQIYFPEMEANAAVEIPAGAADKAGLVVGDFLSW